MRMPSAHAADEVATYKAFIEIKVPFYNEMVPVLKRPVPVYCSFSKRVSMALEVFTGKSDVLRWIQQ